MTLLENWLEVLKRAWSIRLILLAAFFSGLEVVLPILGGESQSGVFAALSFLATAGAFASRLVAQSGLSHPAAASEEIR